MNVRKDLGSHQREQLRLLLRISHSLLLLGASIYLALVYSSARDLIAAVFFMAMVAEWLPFAWRRWLFPEIVLLFTALLSYLWTIPLDQHIARSQSILTAEWSFAGWIRVVLFFWALIPSRLGMARVCAAMFAGELLLFTAQGGTVVWGQAGVLLALALSALAVDAWARSLVQDERVLLGHYRSSQPWPILVPALLLLAIVGAAGGSLVVRTYQDYQEQEERSSEQQTEDRSMDIATSISLGDEIFSDQDAGLSARLVFEPDQAIPPSMFYLRALTTPLLVVEGDQLYWRTATQPNYHFPDITRIHIGHDPVWALLFRTRGSGDIVLRPDHSSQVNLHNLISDQDGNLYRRGLGDLPRRYQVDVGATFAPLGIGEGDDMSRYVQLPSQIESLIREKVPDIERWRQLSVADAAVAIRTWLHMRSRYAIHDLAAPLPGLAGELRAFLFGDADQRRGHCQYFTTATVILLRASGHSARPVLGYASDEISEQGINFRALHTHAWTEYLSSDQTWHRFDSTPAAGLAERSIGHDITQSDGSWEMHGFSDPDDEALDERQGLRGLWILIAGLLFGGGIVYIISARRIQGTPRQRALFRQQDALLRCAYECGIAVHPSTSVERIVADLESRCDISLQQYLQQYLAARFGNGPLPDPWPIAQIRAAYRRGQATEAQGEGQESSIGLPE